MEPIVFAVVVSIVVYMLIVSLIPKSVLSRITPYTKSVLERLEKETIDPEQASQQTVSVMREQISKSNFLTRVFLTLPGAKTIYPKLLKAGLNDSVDKFFLICLIVMLLSLYMLRNTGVWGIVLSVALTYYGAWWYVSMRVRKRNEAFLLAFPDALDMVVRSVRSGYPLNSAVRMVAENMQDPVRQEFKQVADETAYGSTLVDALQRLSYRVDEPDIRFFVVVLTVQQEVGGNLAEVLSNLSGIIRKRKHLRMKIRALTSEGRATTWVLSALPAVVAFAIYMTTPAHLTPLFTTTLGNILLAVAVGIVMLGVFIVRQMVNFEA